MNKKMPDFEFGNLSDVGKVRTENQDYYGRYDESFGHLIIVCDGMGGYTGGAIASRLAVESIYEHFRKLGSQYDPRVEIEHAYLHIQDSIIEYAKANTDTEGMGTTVVLLLIMGKQYWFANLGDSRLYLKRDGLLRQLTKDHSLVQNMVDSGILTEEQAIDHPKRNIITKAAGTDNFIPDISGPYSLCKSDVFMLCSDGLYHYFTLQEMSDILEKEPQEACITFVDIANQKGSDDNVTVQIVKSNIGEPISVNTEARRKVPWSFIILFSVCVVLFASAYTAYQFFKVRSPKSNIADTTTITKKVISADTTKTISKGKP